MTNLEPNDPILSGGSAFQAIALKEPLPPFLHCTVQRFEMTPKGLSPQGTADNTGIYNLKCISKSSQQLWVLSMKN